MTFRLCGDDLELFRERIICLADALARQTGLESRKDENLGGKYLIRPEDRIATRINIYDRSIHAGQPLGLRVNLWPASTAVQADRFQEAVNRANFLALSEQGWEVKPNLNFSFAQKKLHWASALPACETHSYLNAFFSGQRPYSQKYWDELLHLAENWERQGFISSQDRNWINTQYRETNRRSLNVNPEFSVYQDWKPDKLIELEEQGGLEAHVMDALEVPLATWGEQLERPCSMAASAEPA